MKDAAFLLAILATFLLLVNHHLLGMWRDTIAKTLFCSMVGTLALVFLVYGFNDGLTCAGLMLVTLLFTKPLAARLAGRLIKVDRPYPGGRP